MKLKKIVKTVLKIIINIIKIIWIPIVYSGYKKSVTVVYNYWLRNNKNHRLPSNLNIRLEENGEEIFNIVTNEKDFFIEYEKVGKFRYYLYFTLVWIWFDDTKSYGVIDRKLSAEILTDINNKRIVKEINRLCSNAMQSNLSNYDYRIEIPYISTSLLYILILYNTNNNINNILSD